MSQTPAVSDYDSVDVLVIGCGVSGVSTGVHLKTDSPGTTFVILEARDSIGGTWDFFKYPGVRSDSDMFTFGFRFKPWLGEKSLADAGSILAYINETVDEFGLRKHIRVATRVIAADWNSDESRWFVTTKNSHTGEESLIKARVLHSAAGYYAYDEPHTPEFPGRENFKGEIVHPQKWPDDLDYDGKKMIVIGSGATAVTLVPELAKDAEHVTMLQRTPTYILPMPAVDPLAKPIRKYLPEKLAYRLIRWKNIGQFMGTFWFSRRFPNQAKKLIRYFAVKSLPEGFDVDKHFKPPYNPWEQRLCVVPDGDFFKSIKEGSVDVVTDHIKQFDETGIQLVSGEHIDADIIVTATGFDIELFGGAKITVDGEEKPYGDLYSYKGLSVSEVPNFTFTIGYTNASWTLKADLVSEYLARLVNHMKAGGYDEFVAVPPATFKETSPFIDLSAGYVQRAIDDAPRQGDAVPWRVYQSYPRDARMFRHGKIDDGAMTFIKRAPRGEEAQVVSVAGSPSGA